jgi:hypothetical protein
MPNEKQTFEFVVEHSKGGWMVLGGLQALGPFFAKEHAVDLANGMALAMRTMGDRVLVRVMD